MKIAFIASECAPFIKTGGLGDVVGALPKYLNKSGTETIVILPKYSGIKKDLKDKMNLIKSFNVPVGWRNQYCGVLHYFLDDVNYYFLDNEYYFNRDGLYGYFDDAERFAFFSRAALMLLEEIGYQAEVLHCHDWQAGMVPVLLKTQFRLNPFYSSMKTIFTIHNLQFQGVFPSEILWDLFGLHYNFFTDGSLEYHGQVSYMKGALTYSDKITTVSDNYSKEIQSYEYGEGFQGLLQSRNNDLVGIVNGIDSSVYNPSIDDSIYQKYSVDSIDDKFINKDNLQKDLKLSQNRDIPIIAMVTRLSNQKGLNIVASCAEEILRKNVQLVILGTGDRNYEDYFKYLEHKYPGQVSALITFNEALAHKIYAAADIFLMPSVFEPCGLSQLIALNYGTIPLVRETGGLKDTIRPYNYGALYGNGFMFKNLDSYALLSVLDHALYLYHNNKEEWRNIITSAMYTDNSWEKSTESYKNLYVSLVGRS